MQRAKSTGAPSATPEPEANTMTTTTERAELIAQIVAPLTASLSTLEAQERQLLNALVSHNWVIAIPHDGQDIQNGAMYYAAVRDAENPRLMIDVRPVSLENAPRYIQQDAEAICRNGNVRNGHGHTARPVQIREALAAQIAHTRQLLEALEA